MNGPAVLGLDLSLTASGIALPSGQMFTIRARKRGDARLAEIEDAFLYYLHNTGRPLLAMIEAIPAHARGGGHTTVILGMVHGIIRKELARRAIPAVYLDNQILKKYATGHAQSDKQRMIDTAVELGALPADDNQADAWWLRAAGRHWLDPTTAATAQALSAGLLFGPRSKVVWPDRAALRAPDRATR